MRRAAPLAVSLLGVLAACPAPVTPAESASGESSTSTSSTESESDDSQSTDAPDLPDSDTLSSDSNPETSTSTETGGETETETETSSGKETGTETETETGEDSDTGGDPIELCGAGWEPERVIATITDELADEVWLLRADGSRFELDVSLPDAPNDVLRELKVSSYGEWIYAGVHLEGPEIASHNRVYARDSGELLWELASDSWEPINTWNTHVDDAGRVVMNLSHPLPGNFDSAALDGEGVISPLPHDPLTPLDAEGWVFVEEYPPYWLRTTNQANATLSYEVLDEEIYYARRDGTALYHAYIDDELHRVVEDHEGVISTSPEPALQFYDEQGWSLWDWSVVGEWELFSFRNGEDWVSVRIAPDDQVEEFVLEAPPGTWLPECQYGPAWLGDHGEVMQFWRDAGAARLYMRTTPADEWMLVAGVAPITDFARASATARGDTFNVRAFDYGEVNCGQSPQWMNPPPSALEGGSEQFARAAQLESFAIPVPGFTDQLTQAGACVAYPQSDNPAQAWAIHDLLSGEQLVMDGPGRVEWIYE